MSLATTLRMLRMFSRSRRRSSAAATTAESRTQPMIAKRSGDIRRISPPPIGDFGRASYIRNSELQPSEVAKSRRLGPKWKTHRGEPPAAVLGLRFRRDRDAQVAPGHFFGLRNAQDPQDGR